MMSEICRLQANSQIVFQAGKGLELANHHGSVNQNKEQKITTRLKIHNKASYDQAVQDVYDPSVCDVSEVLQGRRLSEAAPRLQMKQAAMPTQWWKRSRVY
jgi:hypothetical protein